MGETDGGAAVDHDVLDDIADRIETDDRIRRVRRRPPGEPTEIECRLDSTYYPPSVESVTLRIRWFENGDVNLHYREAYDDGAEWNCRWDRHPNDHNAREHFHRGPDATLERAVGELYPDDWRDVLARVLAEVDERMRAFRR